MIKFVLAALCVAPIIGLPVARESSSLLQDFQDFADAVEWDRLLALANRYYFKDSDFKSAIAYLQGEEFATVWHGFFGLPAVREVGDYLVDADVPFYDLVQVVAGFIGQSSSVQLKTERQATRGVKGFVEELFELLPVDKFEQLYEEKSLNSAPFRLFMEKLRGADYEQLRVFYLTVDEFRSFIQVVRSYGIDVDGWERSIRDFLGWH